MIRSDEGGTRCQDEGGFPEGDKSPRRAEDVRNEDGEPLDHHFFQIAGHNLPAVRLIGQDGHFLP